MCLKNHTAYNSYAGVASNKAGLNNKEMHPNVPERTCIASKALVFTGLFKLDFGSKIHNVL